MSATEAASTTCNPLSALQLLFSALEIGSFPLQLLLLSQQIGLACCRGCLWERHTRFSCSAFTNIQLKCIRMWKSPQTAISLYCCCFLKRLPHCTMRAADLRARLHGGLQHGRLGRDSRGWDSGACQISLDTINKTHTQGQSAYRLNTNDWIMHCKDKGCNPSVS